MLKALFKKLFGKSPEAVRELIQTTDDETALEEIVFGSCAPELKMAAVKRINNADILKKIVYSQVQQKLINAALSHITDEALLKEIILGPMPYNSFKSTVLFALNLITSETALFDIYRSSEIASVKKRCLERIKDPELLKSITDTETSKKLREPAMRKLKTYMPVILAISIEFKCPHCSQPVFVNGPVTTMSCPFCTSEIRLTGKFWKGILGEAFGGSYSMLGSAYGFNGLTVSMEKGKPRCRNCNEKLTIPDGSAGEEKVIACPACGHSNSLHPAPPWMKDITSKNRKPELVICGEDGDYEKDFYKNVKPVVTSCIECGGSLKIDSDTPRNATCSYCGTLQYLPDPLWFSLHPVKTKKPWYIQWSPAATADADQNRSSRLHRGDDGGERSSGQAF